VAERPKAAVC